jgi:cobyrinic acid a,c-diamide synthase
VGKKHAFIIAGTQSGCGKTTISLGLMNAFMNRGLCVQPFKVGPDFIDPGHHTQITGRDSRNLDGWMLSPDYNRTLFHRLFLGADIAVVEGVMGLYDGYDGTSESGSSAEMAKWLGLPVVLVVDARSMARSAAALVYGFSRFDPAVNLAGVIFNRIGGEGHLEYLREAMSAALPEIPVLGGIPREELVAIPERHLGLVTADEVRLNSRWRESMTRLVERCVDLNLLLGKTEYHQETLTEKPAHEVGPNLRKMPLVSIAVARDAAFCFYYPDNLELLRQAGARIRFFSPLAGEAVPDDAAGLYLGGGYPELFAGDLSGGRTFILSVQRAAAAGMPIHAECGGLMVLSRFIESVDGKRYPMAGVLPFGTRMLEKRKALGYMEVALRQACLLGEPPLTLRGHEFHYSEIVEGEGGESGANGLGFSYEIRGRRDGKVRREGFGVGSVLASYIHLHWGSAPEAPATFVKHCARFEKLMNR